MLYRREGYPEEDELVLCTVTKVLNHAVFVNLDEYDKGALIHISEVAPGRIRNIRDYVELNKKVVCKVLRINSEKGHIDLSLRRVSERDKKNKLEAIKQEQKAEKIIDIASQELKRKTEEVYNIITEKVFQSYPFLYQFFKDVAVGNIQMDKIIGDKKVVEVLEGIVKERFKPPKVAIKGTITMQSFSPKGIEVIKNALGNAEKKGSKKAETVIWYLGGGKYSLAIHAEDYKKAEDALTVVQKSIQDEIITEEGTYSFARKES